MKTNLHNYKKNIKITLYPTVVIALKIFLPLILLANIYIPVYSCEHYPDFLNIFRGVLM